jgi:cytochrome c biogenesis protein CcdA
VTGDLPFALALTAGSVAALNPCGFALLPAYLTLLVAGDGEAARRPAVLRALLATAAMTAGFTGVFVVFGLALAPVAGTLQQRLPWFTVLLGLVLVGAGGWLLAGRSLPGLSGLARRGPALRSGLLPLAGFGAAYALSSLSCTIGPFLAVVVSAFRAGSTLAGVGLFAAYAAGMGLVVGLASVSLALSARRIVRGLRRAAPLVSRLGGLVLLVAGGYVAYYGWYEDAVLRGADPADRVVAAAIVLQQWLADLVRQAGIPLLATLLAGLVLLAATAGVDRAAGPPQAPTTDDQHRRDDPAGPE